METPFHLTIVPKQVHPHYLSTVIFEDNAICTSVFTDVILNTTRYHSANHIENYRFDPPPEPPPQNPPPVGPYDTRLFNSFVLLYAKQRKKVKERKVLCATVLQQNVKNIGLNICIYTIYINRPSNKNLKKKKNLNQKKTKTETTFQLLPTQRLLHLRAQRGLLHLPSGQQLRKRPAFPVSFQPKTTGLPLWPRKTKGRR